MITDMVFGVSNVLVAITTLVSAYLQEVADRTCTLAYLSSRLGLVYASESTVWPVLVAAGVILPVAYSRSCPG